MLAAGWVRPSWSAAARTLPAAAMMLKTSSWRGLIAIISNPYR